MAIMSTLDVYNMNGEKTGTINLNPEIFNIKPNPTLVHQAIVAQQANSRFSIANTKTRSEVRGGGRKPWKQKGTGRARAGSSRSPIWIGGGITFGPTSKRNFTKKFPKKMRRKALFMALSARYSDKSILVLDKLELSKIKTKEAQQLIAKLPVKEGNFLIIIAKSNNNIRYSFANIPFIKLLLADSLNTFDILKYNQLIITKDSFEIIESIYLKNDDKNKPVDNKKEKQVNRESGENKTNKNNKDSKLVSKNIKKTPDKKIKVNAKNINSSSKTTK